MAHDQSSFNYNDLRTPSSTEHEYLDAQNRRPRATPSPQPAAMMTDANNRYPPPQRPIDEAVTTAFNKAETSNHVPSELIAQITQNVIKQLQTGATLDGTTPVPPTQNTFPPPPPLPATGPQVVHQPIPQSPSTASGTSPNMTTRVYTPPSPHKHSDYPSHTTSPPLSQSGYSLPDPPQSPGREQRSTHFSPRSSSSPTSQASEASDKAHVRPKGPSRLSTGKEETTLERIWGQLFDEESRPTVRLSQFLRGLAVHIIEDYEPQHSIVITPIKMVKYYEDVKLAHELYPWETVFDDERSSISRMYRDLECQHHLVQERYDERPDIPGLTPVGFERWVTLLIQAHPEAEFERLQKAVLEMPISNPDDKKERFPKEISRRLFPAHEDRKIGDLIAESISEHASVDIQRRTSQESFNVRYPPAHKPSAGEPYVPQSHRPSVSFAEHGTVSSGNTTYIPSHLERERKPYSNIPNDSAIDDTNPPGPLPGASSNPIERERKPYSAQPGGGKQYEDDMAKQAPKSRAESIINGPKPNRSDSTARARPIPINSMNQRPMEIPKSEVHHHRAPSNASSRRRRSPSFSRGTTNDFRRSDGDIRGYQPTFEAGSAPRAEPVFDETDTRRYFDRQARERAERAKRQAEEEARGYEQSPRRNYDDRAPPRRGDYMNDEDYYRAGGRGDRGNGYDYQQPYGGPVYR